MKRIAVVFLLLLALLPGIAVFAKKNADAHPAGQTAPTDEAAIIAERDPQADTLGGSSGGAPETDMAELVIMDCVDAA